MIVTISRVYGAGAQAVSRALAQSLGYRLVDDELPVVAASLLGTSADVVQTMAERPRGFGERVLEQLGGGVPEAAQLPADDPQPGELRRAIEDAVREEATSGDAVIVGRMASVILADRPGVLRAFIHAPLAWRIAHVVESLHVGEAEARDEIGRIDEARRTYAREGYRVTWGDPRNYDLVLDSSRFGVAGSAAVIALAVRRRRRRSLSAPRDPVRHQQPDLAALAGRVRARRARRHADLGADDHQRARRGDAGVRCAGAHKLGSGDGAARVRRRRVLHRRDRRRAARHDLGVVGRAGRARGRRARADDELLAGRALPGGDRARDAELHRLVEHLAADAGTGRDARARDLGVLDDPARFRPARLAADRIAGLAAASALDARSRRRDIRALRALDRADEPSGARSMTGAFLVSILAGIVALALLAKRLKVPYPIVFVIGGLIVAAIPGIPTIALQPDLVFLLFLPALIFGDGWTTDYRSFKQYAQPIFMLAIGLVTFT